MKAIKKTYPVILAAAALFVLYAAGIYASSYQADKLVSLGVAEYKAERYADAEKLFVKAAARRPSSAAAWMNLGITRARMGAADGAVEALEKAVALLPPGDASLEARRRLVEIYADGTYAISASGDERLARAAAHLEKFIQQVPDDPEPYIQMGRIMTLSGKHATALDYFSRASDIAGASGDSAVHLRLADIYRSLGRADLAQKESGLAAPSGADDEAAMTENM